jgi:signal peptidase
MQLLIPMQKQKSNRYSIILAVLLLTAFLCDNFVFGPVLRGISGNYLYPTVMWGLLFILMKLWLPGVNPGLSYRLRTLLNWLALVCVLIGILALMVQGGMDGFGKSPFDRRIMGISINIVSVGAFIAATEMSRAWLLQRHFLRRPVMGVALLGIVYAFLSIPLSRMLNLHSLRGVIEFTGSTVLPEISQSVLASYLALLGGFWPAFIYHGGLSLVEYISPLLPNAGIISSTLIGTLTPLISLIIVQQIFTEETLHIHSHRSENQLPWALSGMAAIVLIWFCLGVFSFMPRVIISGSMVPTMKIGDIVIVKKISGAEVNEGDVIMFPLANMKVTHRVVAVEEDENGRRMFTTKGDANQSADSDLLNEKAVIGKVVLVIPKAGWLTIALRGWST